MTKLFVAGLIFCLASAAAQAAEPIAGVWRMTKQEVSGREANSNPLLLRVTQTGERLEFGYSVIVDRAPVVMLSFSASLDGAECQVKDKGGDVVGSAKFKKTGPSEYTLAVRPAGRPASIGTMVVSADGKTLTSESDTDDAKQGKIHAVQVFTRI
jgi:hypothetical protein